MNVKPMLRKYFIMGSQNCSRDSATILKEAIAGGITAFQYREKGPGSLTGEAKIELGKRLRKICREHGIPFIINDDIDLIEVLDVDGVHVGQDDTPPEQIREMYPDLIIGLSISNEQELKNSNLEVVDYVGAGPVFTTKTKEDAKDAVGLAWIETLRKWHPDLPIVAIGGINENNAKQVLAAGADGVAFISAVTKSKDITETLKRL